MIRIKKIGGIELDNPLYMLESFEIKNVKAVSFNTLGGSKIVYESIRRDNANNITLDSMENGWLRLETLQKIVNLANELGLTVDLTTTDNSTVKARFRLEEKEVVKAEPLFEGSEWYKVTIKMAYA